MQRFGDIKVGVIAVPEVTPELIARLKVDKKLRLMFLATLVKLEVEGMSTLMYSQYMRRKARAHPEEADCSDNLDGLDTIGATMLHHIRNINEELERAGVRSSNAKTRRLRMKKELRLAKKQTLLDCQSDGMVN